MKKNRDKKYYIVKKKINYLFVFRDIFITMILWGLWIYLLYPLLALVIWKVFQINIFFYYDSLKQIETLEKKLYDFISTGSILIGFITISILSWGYYNKKRFQKYKNKRRIMPKPITSQILAKTLKTTTETIDNAKNAKYIQVYHTNKNSQTPQKIFKEIKNKDFKHVNIIFNDNWEFVRKTSEFGFTHKHQH